MGRQKGSTNKRAAKNKQIVVNLNRIGCDITQIERTTGFSRTWIYEVLRNAKTENISSYCPECGAAIKGGTL